MGKSFLPHSSLFIPHRLLSICKRSCKRSCDFFAHGGFFHEFCLEPRDARYLRGGLTPGIGRFVLHTKGVYLTLYFLALRNLGTFEFAVKDEAIVDAPWVRLCTSCSFPLEVSWIYCIHILRGVILPLLILLQWFPKTSRSGMSRVWLPVFRLYKPI